MKAIFVDKQAKQGILFSCKSELAKHLNKSQSTVLNWSKEGIKQTKEYIICFDATEYKNKSKVRKHGF